MNIKYLSTPIYYPNSTPHVGHLYSTLIADIWKKAAQLLDKKAFISTGLDEHGQKVALAAVARGYSPQEHVDYLSQIFIAFFQNYEITWDKWVRTTDNEHIQAVKHFWKILYDNGYIYKGNYAGWYSISDETYILQKPEGENPNIVWQEEECYYFKLSAFGDKLKEYYAQHPNLIYPQKRYNEVLGFLNQGVKDFVISRPKERLYWGIEVPGDSDHVVYVWVDALVNYLSAIGYPDQKYQNYWPGVHILGKDILKFHAIYWPAMLMAANLPLMQKMIVHGWWLKNDVKISKSLGNADDLDILAQKYQVDGLRYFLIKNIAIGEDGQFQEDTIRSVVYGDLANKFGNIFLRILGIIELAFGGKLPLDAIIFKPGDSAILDEKVSRMKNMLNQILDSPEIVHEYTNLFLECVVEINNYFQNNKIWENKNKQELGGQLYYLMNAYKKITILIYPIMPRVSLEVMNFFGWENASISYYDKALNLEFLGKKPKFFPKSQDESAE